jgi:hypothetical protein
LTAAVPLKWIRKKIDFATSEIIEFSAASFAFLNRYSIRPLAILRHLEGDRGRTEEGEG